MGLDFDLLDWRTWKSSDGNSLEARLISYDGKEIVLKRKKDGKEFTIPRERMSVESIKELVEAQKELSVIAERAWDSDDDFVGFSDPREKMWDLASRVNMVDELWSRATQAEFYHSGSVDRIVSVRASRFERISDKEFYVHGENITLKMQAIFGKFNQSGDKLVLILNNGKREVAVRGMRYMPRLKRMNLMSAGREKVGVENRLVLSISI